jgi:hypothetical protein
VFEPHKFTDAIIETFQVCFYLVEPGSFRQTLIIKALLVKEIS